MSMFILINSCLTTSSLPLFMDLTFQVSMQYWSLQHRILLSSPDTSTTECHFRFGPVAFFLGLLIILHFPPVPYWTPSNLGDSSFSVVFVLLYSLWGSHGKYTGVVFIPSSSGSCFVRTLCYDLSILGRPTQHGSLSFASPFSMSRQWSTKGIFLLSSPQIFIIYKKVMTFKLRVEILF